MTSIKARGFKNCRILVYGLLYKSTPLAWGIRKTNLVNYELMLILIGNDNLN